MARTRRAERYPGPAPGGQEAADPGNLVLAAADMFNEEVLAGTRAPRDATRPRSASMGGSIHIAVRSWKGGGYEDAETAPLVCMGKPEGRRVAVVAPLDDERFCPKCLRGRPHSTGSAIRAVTVLVLGAAR